MYGPSKVGKTWFAGTAGSRTLIINTGDGIDTLLSPGFKAAHPEAEDIIIVDIREDVDADKAEAFDLVGRVIREAYNSPIWDEIDNIVIDEATALRKYALNKATELNTEALKNEAAKAKRKSRLEDFLKPDIGDYGTEMQMIEWFLGNFIPFFKAEKKNFLMLAHQRQIFSKPARIGDDPILKKVQPGFTGKTFPDTVPAYFDDVWHMEAVGGGDNVVYRARTAGSENEVAGNRHNGIFSTVEPDPNYQNMLKRIREGIAKTTRRR